MEYYANAGKKVEIEANGKTYKRHVVKIDYVPVNTSINGLVENYIIPIYKKGDILYISKTLVSICTSQVLYRFDIHVSNLAKNITKNISLIRNANNIVNTYAMQVAIYLIGIIKAMYASLLASFSSNSIEAREKFIKYAGQPVTLIGGLISDSFPEYENFAILPPVGATEICAEIRKKYGITCFIGAMDDSTFNLIACSRDMKISAEELKNIIKDNPLGEKTTSTPLCIIRNAELDKEEINKDINKQ
jgi:asparagine synthase (glutamine-hydrolysing)